jgi:glycosyltransferase involved in cell wall biosynthesis
MPLAVEQFDLTSYDLVISSSHATALGAITGPDTVHVSYIYSPMRFAWDLQPLYLEAFGYGRGVRGAAARGVFHYLRLWDRSASNGVDRFIADSHFVARRIAKAYRRDAMVLHPPVDTQRFMPGTGRGGYFLTGSRMNPFKRIDVVVDAFRSLPDERLVVVGEGPHLKRVAELAGNNVELVGHLSDRELTERMQEATAFIHAAKEDFGIVMAEALACGTPVIAFGEGGATELVRDIGQSAPTGVLFDRQTPDSVADAVREFRAQQDRIDRSVCRSSVLHLGRERFREQFRDMVEFEWKRFHDTSARVTPP